MINLVTFSGITVRLIFYVVKSLLRFNLLEKLISENKIQYSLLFELLGIPSFVLYLTE